MKNAVVFYGEERAEAPLSQDEWQALLEEHNQFSIRHSDAIKAGEALELAQELPLTSPDAIEVRPVVEM